MVFSINHRFPNDSHCKDSHKKSSPRKTASREIGLNGHNIANHAAVEFEKVDVICIEPRGQSEVSIDLR